MKQTLFFFVLVAGCHSCFSQVRRDYRFHQAELPEVLRKIGEADTSYYLVFFPDDLRKCKPVTLYGSNLTQMEAIRRATARQPVQVVEKDRIVAIHPRDIRGWVYDAQGYPVEGATVMLDDSSQQTVTGHDGYFQFDHAYHHDSFRVSHVSKLPQTIAIQDQFSFRIYLADKVASYADVQVYNTGYEFKPAERSSGVFDLISSTTLENRPNQQLTGKLDNLGAGLLCVYGSNRKPIFSIRGRSTLHASPTPLVIVDNFPYAGDLQLLNPEDIAHITILKDAAATSIWGARAGNGVIVITTKGMKKRERPLVTVKMAYGFSPKPDPFYERRMNAADYLSVEQYLFRIGHYDTPRPGYIHSPEGVQILNSWKAGEIDSMQAAAAFEQLGRQDVRDDIQQYYYHRATWQQLHASFEQKQAYFSIGYDKTLSGFTGGTQTRYSLLSNTTVKFAKRLTLRPVISLIYQSGMNDKAMPQEFYPYTRLADDQGRAQVVYRDLSQSYKASLPVGTLRDWDYRPLDELDQRNFREDLLQARIQAGLDYRLLDGLTLKTLYQLQWEETRTDDILSVQSYDFRHLYNSYSYFQGGVLNSPIPDGPINDWQRRTHQAQFLRMQVDYAYNDPTLQLTAVVGAEIWNTLDDTSAGRAYNYGGGNRIPVDYTTDYYMYYEPGLPARIPLKDYSVIWKNYYHSYFANIAVTYKDCYTLTISGRSDHSNLLGAATNQTFIPLWSAGFKWSLSRTPYFNCSWLSYLALRSSIGYSGNMDKMASALLAFTRAYSNRYGLTAGVIQNPPNPDLSWEKSRMINIGVDFTTAPRVLSGSIDYYWRRGRGLTGIFSLDPTSGILSHLANGAAMQGHGFDLTLKSQLRLYSINWHITTLLGFTTHTVTKAEAPRKRAWEYVNPAETHLREGYPADALFSFAWAGLDAANGNPLGAVKDHPTDDYASILDGAPSTLVYNGSTTPRYFASMQHSFRYRGWDLSFMLAGQFDYYFRRPSIHYGDLFAGASWGDPDYARRWQKPGDEQHTSVPSMTYPASPLRDQFYKYSEVLVEKGDHIRLREIRLSKELSGHLLPKPLTACSVYAYISNPFFLYRANKAGIDPDALYFIPTPTSFTIGAKLQF